MALDWNDTSTASEVLEEMSVGNIRVIGVGDGTIGYTAEVPSGMTVTSALEDFASTYATDDPGCSVTVNWELWQDSQFIEAGRWTFEAVL